MSGGYPCKCPERAKPVRERNWRITRHMCNYSAFNGYHRTPSDYSQIQCRACGTIWRTKARYVDDLRTGALQ